MKRASATRLALVGAAAVLLALAPRALPAFWLFLAMSAVIAALVAQSVGVITGRAGIISLCQLSFAAIGGWVVAWFAANHPSTPFLVELLAGAGAAGLTGAVVGLPALRLRGINLAVVTLGVATTVTTILTINDFPGTADFVTIARPRAFSTDADYYSLCFAIFAVVAAALWVVDRTHVGSGWRAIRHSERATASLGVSVAAAKLSAFAVAAAIAGLSGGLLAGQQGLLTIDYFLPLASLAAFAVAVLAAAHRTSGAILAGVLVAFLPDTLRRSGLAQDWGNLFFAVGAILALRTGMGLADLAAAHRPRRRGRGEAPSMRLQAPIAPPGPEAGEPAHRRPAAAPALAIAGLSVHYGSVTALDDVDLVVSRGVSGLIGPNGAGKSTLVDAVTGFLHGYEGSIEISGRRIDDLPAHKRARAGVRRTFQQDRVVPSLTVERYVRLCARRRLGHDELAGLLEFVGWRGASQPVAALDVASRRLVEIAGALASRPSLVLLDEPAAGLSNADSLALASRVATIPERFGCAVLLIEHDMEVVQEACETIIVLDFGQVVVSGPTQQSLSDPRVVAAYLGDEIALA